MFARPTESDVGPRNSGEMNVIALRAALEPQPKLLTIFCVQTYWNDRGRLAEGRVEQFANVESALRAAAVAVRRSPAAKVYRVRGNPEVDYWEESVTVAKMGDRRGEIEPTRR